MPNNREWAILIWLVVALGLMLLKRDLRGSIGNLLATFFKSRTLVLLVAAMFGYVALEIWIGSKLTLWNTGLTTETAIWFVVTGLALFFNVRDASKQRHFYRNRAAAALGIAVYLEFLTNLFVLSLVAELILQPFLVFLGMMSVVAGTNDRHTSVKKLTDRVLIFIGLALLVFTLQQLIVNWDELDKLQAMRELVLPMWLTVGLLPFIYFLSLYSNYEMAFKGIDFHTKGRGARFRAKLAFITKFHLRAREAHTFNWLWTRKLGSADSFGAARKVVDDFRQSKHDEAQAVIEEQERIRRYTGSDALDEDGRRLDRREFEQTTDALRYLAGCHMGWYRNRGGRYRTDMLARLSNDFTRQGLPQDHAITMRVRDDGQAWYAWRRTITGWCFAVGAAGPPPDQWEYDGAEPPSGFPGEDSAWGDGPFDFETSRNW
jgi:hypothetical protein